MVDNEKLFLNGDEAIAQGAIDSGVALGCGYPGTPSTEILEHFSKLGGRAQWEPNEKVALEVAIGVAFSQSRALVTMKHVGLNVAADPLFTVTYSGITGALVIVSADDPGMASSQNEQDNRNYAKASGCPMLEPADSQEAYDFTKLAFTLSEKFHIPFLLRITTRTCHAKSIVKRSAILPPTTPKVECDIKQHVMVPANARPAHKRLSEKLIQIKELNETNDANFIEGNNSEFGIIVSGVSYLHAKEACPDAKFLKLSTTYPLPINKIREFRSSVKRCLVIEEGENFLGDIIRSNGIDVESKNGVFCFGELNVERVKKILANDTSPDLTLPAGKPPELCQGCPHRKSFEAIKATDSIVAGDIGCYTLGAMPPMSAMHTQLCMGASIGMGLGMRHSLPDEEARKVISVIGDSTFIHSGITGLVDALYNKPKTGHTIVILDNSITAMTGLQEHPATGRKLDHSDTNKLILEDLVRGLGVKEVYVVDPLLEQNKLQELILSARKNDKITVIISRRSCILAAKALAKRKAKDNIKEEQSC